MKTHPRTERRQEVDPWFRVEVTDRDGQIVAIETEMLAGRDIGDVEARAIWKAIDHLSGFIGQRQDAAELTRLSSENERLKAEQGDREEAAAICEAKAAHVRENAAALKKFAGQYDDTATVDEARCRELAAMFLDEVADSLRGFPSLEPIRKLAAEAERDKALEALREHKLDAERYRWIRQWAGRACAMPELPEPKTPKEMDAAIDARLLSERK